jgi:hypothetical protein
MQSSGNRPKNHMYDYATNQELAKSKARLDGEQAGFIDKRTKNKNVNSLGPPLSSWNEKCFHSH